MDEEFAFIPSPLRSHLNLLTAPDKGTRGGMPHRYFVDGAPVVSDVRYGSAWHKVVIGSLGAGDRQVFALDIADSTNLQLLAAGHGRPLVAAMAGNRDGKIDVLVSVTCWSSSARRAC